MPRQSIFTLESLVSESSLPASRRLDKHCVYVSCPTQAVTPTGLCSRHARISEGVMRRCCTDGCKRRVNLRIGKNLCTYHSEPGTRCRSAECPKLRIAPSAFCLRHSSRPADPPQDLRAQLHAAQAEIRRLQAENHQLRLTISLKYIFFRFFFHTFISYNVYDLLRLCVFIRDYSSTMTCMCYLYVKCVKYVKQNKYKTTS